MRRRTVRRFLAVLVAVMLIGTLYEAGSEALDRRRYPPPGRMVEMGGGYALHLYCTGEGSPTVILEAGLGGGVATWPLVQPEVAKYTRVCSYDRSGWAWSGGSPPASGQETVARLHTLLQNADVQAPYILVGHSLGGLYNQLYAAAYPDEVAGMVLVEARHQDFATSLPARLQPGTSLTHLIGPVATRVGLVRAALHLGAALGIGPDVPLNMTDMAIRPSSQAAASREQELIPAVEAEVRAAHLNLGDKPLEVLTCDPALCADESSQIWLETQRRYLSLSTDSHLAAAPGARHMVPLDNPAAVTGAVLTMVQGIRP